MTDRAQALLREALALPLEERADVAAELLASLDGAETDIADVEAAWAAEIDKRPAECWLENRWVFPGKTSDGVPRRTCANRESARSIRGRGRSRGPCGRTMV